MTVKTTIINILLSIGNAILKWFGETATAREEQQIKQVVNVGIQQPPKNYIKMSDSVKNFITCDMSPNDKVSAITQITLYENAGVDPYTITIKDGAEGYKIHNGQVVSSWKGA